MRETEDLSIDIAYSCYISFDSHLKQELKGTVQRDLFG
jgi:hypothetical protein